MPSQIGPIIKLVNSFFEGSPKIGQDKKSDFELFEGPPKIGQDKKSDFELFQPALAAYSAGVKLFKELCGRYSL